MKSNRCFARWALVVVLLGAAAAAMAWLGLGKSAYSGPPERVRIAFPSQPGSALLYVAQERGFFRDQGIEFAGQATATGKQALDLMMQGKAELSIVADLPLVMSVAKGQKPIVLATVFRDHGSIGVVARRDRGITSAEDLRGKRIGVPFGTSGQFFLDAFLVERQISIDAVTLVDVKFDEIADAIVNGQIDAACAWDPALSKMQEGLKEQGLTFDSSSQYTFRFQLVASEQYLQVHKGTMLRVVAALNQAQTYVAEQPAQARAIVLKGTGMSEAVFKRAYDPGEIGLLLDQGLLLALDDQTRWAMKRGLIKGEQIPNYLNYLNVGALKAVNPQAVTLVH